MKRVICILFFIAVVGTVKGQTIIPPTNNINTAPSSIEKESLDEEAVNGIRRSKKAASKVQYQDEEYSTYERNYNAYLNAEEKNEKAFKYLQKAYEVYPSNVGLYDDFMAYYEMTGNRVDRKSFSTKLYKSNTISNYIMEYNYNVLMSLPSNAILFTNGYDDTYPVWVLQDVKTNRQDVTIINIGFLKDKKYRDKVFKEAGLVYNKKLKETELITDVVRKNASKNIYIAMTVDKKIITQLYKNLYLTGLVFNYSEQPINNIAITKDKWENQFQKKTIESVPSSFKQKQVLANYLLPCIYLHNHYVAIGERQKAKEIKSIALKIAAYNGKKELIASKLKE